jgi:serine/threonine protein kinase
VSPSNIVISYEGAVKLVDFGVAKAATSSVKTRTGTLKGKIAYMSPEQAKGSPIDRRSDIFSLGIVLWELLTTNRLYKGDNDLATIQMIINSKARRPSQLNPTVPPELDRIVLRALAIDVEERYQTAEQLQLELEAVKLAQSGVNLRGLMQALFEPEIDAWNHAQASGRTLIEHLVINPPTELTMMVSENEIDFVSEDEESFDDEDLADSEQATAMHVPLDPRRIEEPLFPVAPPEWRRADPAIPAQRIKRILIAASIAFAVFVLLVAILI